MEQFINAVLEFEFMQYALLAGLLVSISCGITGSYVYIKRLGFLAGGIAHAIFAGMGIAYYLGYSPILGAVLFAIFAALVIGWIHLSFDQQEDILISAFWSVGMAIGIIFLYRTPGYNIDLMSYLFGNILMVSKQDLGFIIILNSIILLSTLLFYRSFLLICFDQEFATLRGISVRFYYLFLLCLIALTVVLLIQIVGLVLVLALLTLPAAMAAQYTHSLAYRMLISVLLGGFFTTGGLALSYQPNLPAGASIILLAGLSYLCSLLLQALRKKWQQHKTSATNKL